MISGVALVTGASGQDGSYLVERLVDDGYAVHAAVRPGRPTAAPAAVTVHPVDLKDRSSLQDLVDRTEPTEIYHLGGVSSVATSWADPVGTAEITGMSTIALLEAALALQERCGRPVRFILASSAEIFGEPSVSPQTEETPVRPVSPYGAAKALAHASVDVFRRRGLPASSVVLYNHESPRRPPVFVTRKITLAVAAIARSGAGTLTLGNLDARRDWGWAPDYVDAMVRAARAEPDTFIIATGESHSVRDFVDTAFHHVGISGWEQYVATDPALLRPADPPLLVGDASRARTVLGWRPSRSFAQLVGAMVDHDVAEWRSPP